MRSTYLCDRQAQILLTLVLLAILTFSSALATPAWALVSTTTGDTVTPLQVQLKLDKLPTLGQTATLSCVATTARPAPNTTVAIELPAGATVVGGNAQWSGSLQPGAPVTLTANVRFSKLGNTEIACRARNPIDAVNSWGDLGALYFSIGQLASQVGFKEIGIPLASYKGDGEGQTEMTIPDTPRIPSNAAPLPNPPATALDSETAQPAPDAPAGNLTVTGYWKYYNRSDSYVPMKKFLVELVNGDTAAHLAWCYTDANGYYLCGPVTNPGTAGVRTYVRSYVNYNPYADVLQVTLQSCGTTIGCTYPTQTGKKVFADGTRSMGTWYVPNGANYERAYWTKDDLDKGWRLVWFNGGSTSTPQETAGPSTVFWSLDSVDGTYYNLGGQIHLKGVDPLSHDTALHEYAHNIMYNKYGGWFPTTYCPSPHYINGTSHVNCAWTEGWADYFPLAVNNSPVYNWASGSKLNLETPNASTPNFDDGEAVEGRVAGALWDITDALVDGIDTYTAPFAYVWDTLYHQTDSTFREYYLAWIARGHTTAPQSAIYQNTIDYRKPGYIFLLSPANGYATSSHTVDMDWSGAARATYYKLQVRAGTSYGTLVINTTTANHFYSYAFSGHNYYYWRAAACNTFGCNGWTTYRYFRVKP